MPLATPLILHPSSLLRCRRRAGRSRGQGGRRKDEGRPAPCTSHVPLTTPLILHPSSLLPCAGGRGESPRARQKTEGGHARCTSRVPLATPLILHPSSLILAPVGGGRGESPGATRKPKGGPRGARRTCALASTATVYIPTTPRHRPTVRPPHFRQLCQRRVHDARRKRILASAESRSQSPTSDSTRCISRSTSVSITASLELRLFFVLSFASFMASRSA